LKNFCLNNWPCYLETEAGEKHKILAQPRSGQEPRSARISLETTIDGSEIGGSNLGWY